MRIDFLYNTSHITWKFEKFRECYPMMNASFSSFNMPSGNRLRCKKRKHTQQVNSRELSNLISLRKILVEDLHREGLSEEMNAVSYISVLGIRKTQCFKTKNFVWDLWIKNLWNTNSTVEICSPISRCMDTIFIAIFVDAFSKTICSSLHLTVEMNFNRLVFNWQSKSIQSNL